MGCRHDEAACGDGHRGGPARHTLRVQRDVDPDAARPRGAIRAHRGRHHPRRAAARPDPVHAPGRRLGPVCDADRRTVSWRIGGPPRPRRARRRRLARGAARPDRCETLTRSRPAMTAFQRTVASFQQGARTMPREYYTSPAILAEEWETIFARAWNCVGRASAIPQRGDYMLRTVAGESLIIVRGADDTLRAFFNICRHRGTRLCTAESGRFSGSILCPYHAWTFGIDGRLIGAPHMQEVEGFRKQDYPLHAAALAEWEGFIFVNIAERPGPVADWFAPMLQRLPRFNLSALKVGHQEEDDVAAHSKPVFQHSP